MFWNYEISRQIDIRMDTNSIYKSMRTKNASAMSIFILFQILCTFHVVLVFLYLLCHLKGQFL